jgi:DNA adenine methylase
MTERSVSALARPLLAVHSVLRGTAAKSLRNRSIASPVSWLGGKARLAPKIIEYFPPHQTYCEVFGGSGAVLLAKERSKIEVYNDIDRELVNLFRVLRDARLFKKLCRSLDATLYARAEFELARQDSEDVVESARRFMVRQRQSFSGKGARWSYSVEESAVGIRCWRKGVACLPAVHRRFKDVQIECDDWRTVMSRYDSPETLYFLDPPYHPDTRVGGGYRHELTHRDHRAIVDCVLAMRGMIILSGYDHETYKPLERTGWQRVDYHVRTHASDYRARRVESIWLSPSVVNHANRNLFLSPLDRQRQGAYRSHKVRVEGSTKRVLRAIAKFRAAGKKVTISGVGRATDLSREHLSRNYRHLFQA